MLKDMVIACFKAGLVPFLQGSPGIGKSSVIKQIAKENNLMVIDHRLSTSAPEDLTGLPTFKDGHATFMPFDIFPTENTPIPKGYNGWLLFLDELNAAPKSIMAAAYKLILDREVGQKKLHPNVVIATAGNKLTDRAVVNTMPTAMASRLIHIDVDVNVDEWMTKVAIPNKFNSKVLAYISMNPSYLMDFNPEMRGATFCCPRTWEFASKLVTNYETITEPTAHDRLVLSTLLKGTISEGTAIAFMRFYEIFDQLPKLEDIIKNPSGAPIPTDTAACWAMMSSVYDNINKDNVEPLTQYIERFLPSFQALFAKLVYTNKRVLISNKRLCGMLVSLGNIINEV